MNSVYDSEATYCSEVEELMKLTTEINNSSSYLSVRRSQRLSQKRPTNSYIFGNNVKKSLTKQKLPNTNKALNVGVLHKTTQDVFSTQDLLEARELPITNLTCRQQKNIVSTSEKYLPLNLSTKIKGSKNEIVFTHDLREHQDLPHDKLTNQQQRVVTLNDNVNNISVTISAIPKKVKLLGAQKDNIHLDLSMKSKLSQKGTSVAYLKENRKSNRFLKTSNENVKQYLSCASNIASPYDSVQDFQQQQKIQNLPNEPITSKPKLSNKVKTRGRPRITSNTVKQSNKQRIKRLPKNKELDMNFIKVNARPNELKYGKYETGKNTQSFLTKSILPDAYPSHFKYQLPPEAIYSRPLVTYQTIITPETTPSYEFQNSSSTSPSLPDSLRGIFDTDDIKDILNIEKVSYRLYDYHVQALAVYLNLRIEYLLEILDKILKMNSNVLKTFDKAMKMPFAEDRDLFEITPEGSSSNEEMVQNSQSPQARKILNQTESNLKPKMLY